MTDKSNRRRWRNFLIYPSFQFRLALIQIVFIGLVVLIILSTLVFTQYSLDPSVEIEIAHYVTAQLTVKLLDRIGLIILLISAGSGLYHIYFSHRLCGPLINIGHSLDRMASGDFTRKVFLRRKDFLKGEAHRINTVLDFMNARINELKKNQAELYRATNQLPDGAAKEILRNLLENNQSSLDQWEVAQDAPSADRTG